MNKMRFQKSILLILTFAISLCAGQFPLTCMTVKNFEEKECCPIGNDGSKCNSKGGRGYCSQVVNFYYQLTFPKNSLMHHDDRLYWPSKIFTHVCVCQERFGGVDCGSCEYGWTGENCDIKKPLRKRKSAIDMTQRERKQFLDVLIKAKTTLHPHHVIITDFSHKLRLKLKNATSQLEKENIFKQFYKHDTYWNVFAWLHYYSARATFSQCADDKCHQYSTDPVGQMLNHFAHRGSAFTIWHRLFLLKAEEMLSQVSGQADFTIPYWDWTAEKDGKTCSICTDDFMGSIDLKKPFTPVYNWLDNATDPNFGPIKVTNYRLSSSSPLSNWTVVCGNCKWYLDGKRGYNFEAKLCPGNSAYDQPLSRCLGCHLNFTTQLPRASEVDAILKMPFYDRIDYNTKRFSNQYNYESNNQFTTKSFRNALEGFIDANSTFGRYMHNQVHIWLGGTMYEVPIAANDPLFFLHHANVDRIFEKWLQRAGEKARYNCQVFGAIQHPDKVNDGPQGCQVGQDYRENLAPFFPLKSAYQMFKRAEQFGYIYAN